MFSCYSLWLNVFREGIMMGGLLMLICVTVMFRYWHIRMG